MKEVRKVANSDQDVRSNLGVMGDFTFQWGNTLEGCGVGSQQVGVRVPGLRRVASSYGKLQATHSTSLWRGVT